MAYIIDGRVSYSRTDKNRLLRISSIIDYFQDCGTFHSEDSGVGFEYLEKNHLAWLLTTWQIVIRRMPEHGEKIKISTWPWGFRNCYGDRNFEIRTEDGELLVYANSLWVLTDTEKKRHTRIPEAIPAAIPCEPGLDMEYAPRKIKVSGEYEEFEPVKVHMYNIDSNGHVNNGQYVRIAEGFIPEDLQFSEFRVEYKTPAVLGDEIIPRVYRQDGRFVIRLEGSGDRIFAIVELI